MGQLKFKAWLKNEKRMVEVFKIEFTPNADCIGIEYLDKTTHHGNWTEPHYKKHNNLYEPIPLMQYTGLKDKNGVEIYEGDILDFDEVEWGGKFEPEVITIEKIIGDFELCGGLQDIKEWRQVIGNIHENPELLEKT